MDAVVARQHIKWQSPEVHSGRGHTLASDVWSFGVVLWEIISYAETPFEDLSQAEVVVAVERGER